MGSEQGPSGRRRSLGEIGRAAARIADALARLAEAEAGGPAAAEPPEPPEPLPPPEVDARFVRNLIKADRLRAAWFGAACGDPGWAVLTALLLARLEGRAVRLSAIAAEAALPSTTAARRVDALCEAGLVVRLRTIRPRGVRIALADEAAAALEAYLKAALRP